VRVKITGSSNLVAAGVAAVLAAALLAGSAALRAAPQQSPQPAPGPPPAAFLFRALLADGRPFTDIRPEDLEVKVDGRARKLESVQFVGLGGGDAGAAPAELPPPYATNLREAARRDTYFVVEDDSIAAGMAPAVRDAILQFIGHLAPQDRVGVLTVPRAGLNVNLTTDREKVKAAVSELSGRAPRTEADADAACRTQQTLAALINVFRSAAGVPPATVIVFGGGLTPPMATEMSSMNATTNLCFVRVEDYREVEAVLLDALVNVSVIHVPNLGGSGAAASTSQTQGLEHLAGITGNWIIRLVGDSGEAMTRLARATSGYYRASFMPQDSERNGAIRSLSVKVNRPDVGVFSAPNIVIPSARGSRSASKSSAPRDMLRVGSVYRDLPMRAAAYVSREGADDRARVVVLVEPMDAASLKAAAVGLYDDKGKLVAQATADQESLARTPPTIALVVKTGTYRMRVAATDAGGRAGTVDSALDAKLAGEGPLKLSSLVLGVAVEGRFAGRLQFYEEPTAVAYLEIYGVPKGELTAELQLAGIEGGPPAVRGAMRITGEPSDDQHVALGGIPIGALPPGDLVVRAVVSLDGVPAGAVTRTLRKAER
jgi:hypothetical protein